MLTPRLTGYLAVTQFLLTVAYCQQSNTSVSRRVKDGKISIQGVVISTADFEQAEATIRLLATMNVSNPDSLSFGLKTTDGKRYDCYIRPSAYPNNLELGDSVTVQGTGYHEQVANLSFYTIMGCRITAREPGPAKHVNLDGTIVEHKEFPASRLSNGLVYSGPSDSFTINVDGKNYSCFISHGGAEFKDYRPDDNLSVSGVLSNSEATSVDRCRVVSHQPAARK